MRQLPRTGSWRWLAAAGSLVSAFGLPASAQIASWSVDFNDPAEPARWQLDYTDAKQTGRVPGQIRWSSVLRNPSRPEEGRVLEVVAGTELWVETRFSLYRKFSDSFRPDPDNDLVFEWDWMIRDTEQSDAVTIGSNDIPCH